MRLRFFLNLLCILGVVLFPSCSSEKVATEVYQGNSKEQAPETSVDSVGRPRFTLKEGESRELILGTGFLVEHRLEPVMVGCYHTLSSAEGVNQETVDASLYSKRGKLGTPRLARSLKVPSQARASYVGPTDSDTRGDMAAFFVKDIHRDASPLKVAKSDPKLGQPLWVVEMTGSATKPSGIDLVPGKVHYLSNHLLSLKMDRETNVKGTSGAPIVNSDNEVVGINSGYVKGPEGYFRLAVPVSTLRKVLEEE